MMFMDQILLPHPALALPHSLHLRWRTHKRWPQARKRWVQAKTRKIFCALVPLWRIWFLLFDF
jgi:hypothetical protein